MAAQWSIPVEENGTLQQCCEAFRIMVDAGQRLKIRNVIYAFLRTAAAQIQRCLFALQIAWRMKIAFASSTRGL